MTLWRKCQTSAWGVCVCVHVCVHVLSLWQDKGYCLEHLLCITAYLSFRSIYATNNMTIEHPEEHNSQTEEQKIYLGSALICMVQLYINVQWGKIIPHHAVFKLVLRWSDIKNERNRIIWKHGWCCWLHFSGKKQLCFRINRVFLQSASSLDNPMNASNFNSFSSFWLQLQFEEFLLVFLIAVTSSRVHFVFRHQVHPFVLLPAARRFWFFFPRLLLKKETLPCDCLQILLSIGRMRNTDLRQSITFRIYPKGQPPVTDLQRTMGIIVFSLHASNFKALKHLVWKEIDSESWANITKRPAREIWFVVCGHILLSALPRCGTVERYFDVLEWPWTWLSSIS